MARAVKLIIFFTSALLKGWIFYFGISMSFDLQGVDAQMNAFSYTVFYL